MKKRNIHNKEAPFLWYFGLGFLLFIVLLIFSPLRQATIPEIDAIGAQPTWSISGVDTADDVGKYLSQFVLNKNTIFISYFDETNGDLKFAKSTNGGTSFSTQTVDSSGVVGKYTSISVPDEDTVYISYFDEDNGALKLATSTNGGTSFSTQTVDNTETSIGLWTSIEATSTSTIFIAYQDATNGDVELAKSTNSGASWTFTTVDSTGTTGEYIALDAVDASTVLVYYVTPGTNAKISTSTNGGTSFSVTSTNVAARGHTDIIALDASNLFTTYFDSISNLNYQRSANGGSTFNSSGALEFLGGSTQANGRAAAIDAVDSDNFFIAYYNDDDDELQVSHTDVGLGAGYTNVVDTPIGTEAVGYGLDLHMVDLNTHYLAYYDNVTGDLNFAIGTVTPFAIQNTTPASNAFGVAVDANIVVQYESFLNTSSFDASSFIVHGSQSGFIPGAFSFSQTVVVNDTMTFNPTTDFFPGETITVIATKNVLASGNNRPGEERIFRFHVGNGAGTNEFTAQGSVAATGSFVIKGCAADFNDDGDIDLAFSEFSATDFFTNDGTGSFTMTNISSFGATDIVCMDLNNDNYSDLAYTDQSGNLRVSISNGNDTFAAEDSYNPGIFQADALQAVDLNQDGFLDIAIAESGALDNNQFFVLLNNGDGTFGASQAVSIGSGNSYEAINFGDLDNDGLLDVVVQEDTTGNPDFLSKKGSGDGTFEGTEFSVNITIGNGGEAEILLADFDGDSHIDAIPLHNSQDFSVLIGQSGSINFGAPQQSVSVTGGSCEDGNLGDNDNDGDLDIYLTCLGGGFHIIENDGTATFTVGPQTVPVCNGTNHSIVPGDFNGDTIIDVAIGCGGASNIEIFFGKGDFMLDSSTPDNFDTNIELDANIQIIMEDSVDLSTLTQANLPVFGSMQGFMPAAYSLTTTTVTNDTIIINPTNDFLPSERIQYTITSNVKNTSGIGVTDPIVREFFAKTPFGATSLGSAIGYGGSGSFWMCSGDFNDDGDVDVVTNTGAQITIFENNGLGVFTQGDTYSSGSHATCADINNDGNVDILTAGGSFQYFISDGDHTFTGPTSVTGSTGGNAGIAAGDVNGDGFLDVLTGRNTNSIFINNGNGTFANGVNYSSGTTNQHEGKVLADFDGDGFLDIATTIRDISSVSQIRINFNNGDGTFGSLAQTLSQSQPDSRAIEAADVDGDNVIDLLTSNSNDFSVSLNNGSGTFNAPVNYSIYSGGTAQGTAVGDQDADGNIDHFSAEQGTNVEIGGNNGSGVFTLLAQPTIDTWIQAVTVADFNGDGTLDNASVSGTNGLFIGLMAITPGCGNNFIEGAEVCDGTNLNGHTCASVVGAGYTGTLTCDAGCGFFDTSACSSAVCEAVPSHLVNWWPGDFTANDFNGLSNGTLNGDTTFTPGQVGQAFSFDGAGDFVNIPEDPRNDIQANESFSITGWMNTSSAQNDMWLVSKHQPGTGNGYALITNFTTNPYCTTPGHLTFYVASGGGDDACSDAPVNDGSWHHFAGVYDANSNVSTLYVDGVAQADLGTSLTTLNNNVDLKIGALEGPQGFYNGLLDEIELHRKALSAQEVLDIYNAGSSGKCKLTCTQDGDCPVTEQCLYAVCTEIPACFTNPSDLVSWWDGDSVSGVDALDIQGGNTGLLSFGATTAPGKVGQAFSFDGVDDLIVVSDDSSLQASNGLTISAWVKVDSIPDTSASHVVDRRNGTEDGYILAINGTGPTTVSFTMDLSSGFNQNLGSADISDGRFHHLAGVFNGTTSRIYVDGVLDNEIAATGTINYDPIDLIIGGNQQPAATRYFDGLIDEVQIFERGLSSQEVVDIYFAGSAGVCKPACGNSIVDMGETCDDGNLQGGDGCSASCQTESLRVISGGGGGSSSASSTSSAAATGSASPSQQQAQVSAPQQTILREASPECGNGSLESGEECDDGNITSGDGCDEECKIEELAPEPQIILNAVLPPTRDRGLRINLQAAGAGGLINVSGYSGEVEVSLAEVEILPNIPLEIEIEKSTLSQIQSFDYSTIFYEISKKDFSAAEYYDVYTKALDEQRISLEISLISEDEVISEIIEVDVDTIPPEASIDTQPGAYSKPLLINIQAN